MDALLEVSSEERHARNNQTASGSQADSNIASSEQSAKRGGAGAASGHDDHAFPVGPEILPALQPPSEARFKQLASLQLLRATYQEEDDAAISRLSVERVLQSAQKQNMAHKIRLALMQQQISDQLRIVETRESRLAELLGQLQSLTAQSTNLLSHEDSVLRLVRDMNDYRAGNPQEWPAFMVDYMNLAPRTWMKWDPIRSGSQICHLFLSGEAASSHLQLSLAPYDERPISLQEMASYSPDFVFGIMSSYKEAIIAQLPAVASSVTEQAAQAMDRIKTLADELFLWCCCLVFGQPYDYAVRNPWLRNTPMTSIPLDVMQDALDHAQFRDEQLAELQQLFQQHRSSMASLEEKEQFLRSEICGQLNQASGVPGCQDLYLPLMDTVAELEANWKAQTHHAFIWGILVIGKVAEPLQVAKMMAYLAPYPFRPDLILETGLGQPNNVSSYTDSRSNPAAECGLD